eukprot:CAMPEP_0169186436 /NCGR_PEP_ID=MMETSP1016-20121227/2365_1 /TAXON_ID=342587 /ORGANISM="Karlodinium micrum, Strain CCMP2283" /LENGTH=381 /DNA_ID=CAMNT_0009262279 /DNA_START=41 /DNA_END=1184 /DNA_ORIENTATION=+
MTLEPESNAASSLSMVSAKKESTAALALMAVAQRRPSKETQRAMGMLVATFSSMATAGMVICANINMLPVIQRRRLAVKHWHGWKDGERHRRSRWGEGTYDYGNVCCHFLQYGSCERGETCKFKHAEGDPDTTLCGFGVNCKHWHGWALHEQTNDHSQSGKDADVNPKSKHGDSRTHSNEYTQKGRVCCSFLEWGSCSWGHLCSFEHVRADRATTRCGVGVNCRHGHGRACHTGNKGDFNKGDGPIYLNIPNKLLRAVINSLLGSWHSKNSADKIFQHTISLGTKSGSQLELLCRTFGPGDEEVLERIRYDGGDLVLGTDFFLDVSCDRFLVWMNPACSEEKLVWTRGVTTNAWKASDPDHEADAINQPSAILQQGVLPTE